VKQPGASGGHLTDFSGQIEGSSLFFQRRAAGKFPARSRQCLLKPGGWPVSHDRRQPWAGDRMPFGNCRYMNGHRNFHIPEFLRVRGTGKGLGLPEGRTGLDSELIILLSDTDMISGKELGVDDLI
jgi:hypothetical protein